MLDGLWLVQLHSPSAGISRAGVIVFEGTQIMGGDSSYYYSGAFSTEHQGIIMNIRARKHSPGMSVFGHLMDCRLILQGKLSENTMLFEGLVEHREIRLQAKLSRLP